MNIVLGKNSGFCAGVRHTIAKAEEILSKNSGLTFCLGEIIHNKQVINRLEENGLKTINSIEEANR